MAVVGYSTCCCHG